MASEPFFCSAAELQPTNTPSWKWLWKVPTISRVSSFLWLACHNRLSTKAHLVTRHIINDDSCPLCHSTPETTIYILRDCPAILPIWNDLAHHTFPMGFLTSNLPNWLQFMATSTSPTLGLPHIPWRTTFPLAVWIIWSTCNKLVMEGRPFISQHVIDKIKATA